MNVLRALTWVLLLVLLCVFIPVCRALLLILPRGVHRGDQ